VYAQERTRCRVQCFRSMQNDPGVWCSTLPDRELASGISEIIKYGLIRDAPFFEWLEANIGRLLARDQEARSFAALSVHVDAPS